MSIRSNAFFWLLVLPLSAVPGMIPERALASQATTLTCSLRGMMNARQIPANTHQEYSWDDTMTLSLDGSGQYSMVGKMYFGSNYNNTASELNINGMYYTQQKYYILKYEVSESIMVDMTLDRESGDISYSRDLDPTDGKETDLNHYEGHGHCDPAEVHPRF